jgi:Transposase DDE domain
MSSQTPVIELKPDKRSLARCNSLLSRLVGKRSCILRQLSCTWSEEMGYWRLLKNPKMSVRWLTEWVLQASKVQFCVSNRHILSIQDSSTIGFQVRASQKTGLSAIGCNGDRPGFIVHPNLVLDAQDGRCLGLGALSILDQWVAKGPADTVKHLESAEKKTGRWLESGKAARDFLKDAQTITHIADREADFYEMLLEFGQAKQANEHLIVRVNDDRLLGHMEGRGRAKGKKGDEKVQTTQNGQNIDIHFPYRAHLNDVVARLPVQAQWFLKLQDNPKREAREAKVALRYMSKVPIRRPTKLYKRTYEGKTLPFFLYINVIDLVEIMPDNATYTPMHWRIYTSHTLENVEQAKQVVQWYCWRWKIELFFATVKSSGLNLEFALVEYGDKLKKLAILVLMAAIQVIQLLQARDGQSQQMITDCFSPEEVELIQQLNPKLEGNTQKQKNPHNPQSMAFATWVMARLGGWKGLRTQRPPGIKTISRGLMEFFKIKYAKSLLDNSV